jgi:hypothetical protein
MLGPFFFFFRKRACLNDQREMFVLSGYAAHDTDSIFIPFVCLVFSIYCQRTAACFVYTASDKGVANRLF